MSVAYKEYLEGLEEGQEPMSMRDWCKRPGKRDEDGKIVYKTEQSHKDECDINMAIRKHDRQGLIMRVQKFEGKFGDLSGADFQKMQNQVADAKTQFEMLPADIRNKFENEPKNLLQFMEDPNNRDAAIELGLIKEAWTEETDGLGEHVKEGENVEES